MPGAPTLDRHYLHPGDRICVAISGGADSVALLLLLHEANRTPRNALGVGLTALHVHHGLRQEEADADAAFVQELCARLDIPLRLFHVSVPERLAQSRASGRAETTEEAARELRHACFRTVLEERTADTIVTAHTLDDQAETVLMKLLRGAWTEGLGGIHPRVPLTQPAAGKGSLVRPLLAVRRADLRDFLTARNQPWREDSSNLDPAHTRNRLRHQLLPQLRSENPSIDETFARLATLAREDEAHWSTELARVLPHLLLPGKPVRGGGRSVATSAPQSMSIQLERLRPLDSALRRRVLRAAASTLGVRLTFDETERLFQLAESTRFPARTELSAGLKAERTARELRLERTAGPSATA